MDSRVSYTALASLPLLRRKEPLRHCRTHCQDQTDSSTSGSLRRLGTHSACRPHNHKMRLSPRPQVGTPQFRKQHLYAPLIRAADGPRASGCVGTATGAACVSRRQLPRFRISARACMSTNRSIEGLSSSNSSQNRERGTSAFADPGLLVKSPAYAYQSSHRAEGYRSLEYGNAHLKVPGESEMTPSRRFASSRSSKSPMRSSTLRRSWHDSNHPGLTASVRKS